MLKLRIAPLLVGLVLVGCSAGSPAVAPDPAGSPASSSPPQSSSASPTPQGAVTKPLDSIAVLGHSGATGTMSDPKDPNRDAVENSWATGDNPAVQSVYLRLLKTHPALQGHNYNVATNGTKVDALLPEFTALLREADPLPDVLFIQSIDNDMRCDGTDPDNYAPYGAALDKAITTMQQAIPGVQVFLVSQWASVKLWTEWAAGHEDIVSANSGDGPCGVFDAKGRPRAAGIRSMQAIVDAYWEQVVTVCKAHPGCFTDGGAEQTFTVLDKDLAPDGNHLSIAGHRKYAAIVWGALPAAITQRP